LLPLYEDIIRLPYIFAQALWLILSIPHGQRIIDAQCLDRSRDGCAGQASRGPMAGWFGEADAGKIIHPICPSSLAANISEKSKRILIIAWDSWDGIPARACFASGAKRALNRQPSMF
jgi:hypothetical protein